MQNSKYPTFYDSIKKLHNNPSFNTSIYAQAKYCKVDGQSAAR
jgi:hypothetical protein